MAVLRPKPAAPQNGWMRARVILRGWMMQLGLRDQAYRHWVALTVGMALLITGLLMVLRLFLSQCDC